MENTNEKSNSPLTFTPPPAYHISTGADPAVLRRIKMKTGEVQVTDIPPIVVNRIAYSRQQIARETGISLSHISKLFSGSRQPSLPMATRLACFFGISIEELMTDILPSIRRVA